MSVDLRQKMQAKAAELAALAKSHHITYVGAENHIAAYAEQLAPVKDSTAPAWNLYDYGIEQFRAFHSGPSGSMK